MSYWTNKQKILFVDIDLHLIKIVYHFMEAVVYAEMYTIIFVNKYLRVAVLGHTGLIK